MPKILINERDNTTPGTPSGYANYSVLIPGFIGRTPILTADVIAAKQADPESKLVADKIQPDSNGIYEFNSAQSFIDTIGLVQPKANVVVTGEAEDATSTSMLEVCHYGNQMAYELLNQGYSIIYMPITADTCVDTLMNASTWEIFKDKANYDFRFVTHGLLESADTSVLEAEKRVLNETLRTLHNREVLIYDEETLSVVVGSESQPVKQLENADLENVAISEANYQELYSELTAEESPLIVEGLKDKDGVYYTTGLNATTNILKRLRAVLTQLSNSLTDAVINTVNVNIANLAKYSADESYDGLPGRGDCIALLELDEKLYVNHKLNPELAIIEAIDILGNSGINQANGKYCALTVPSVYYTMKPRDEFNGNVKFPGAFHYLACFMYALQNGFAEWYATAGYTRGVSSYSIDNTSVTLGEIAINALEPRQLTDNGPKFACNVIANFRGSYYLWGNRTAHGLTDANAGGDLVASHFLNIRQLCTTIKKQLYVACRRFTFDPNSDTLWFNFINAIRPTLETMKADQGIRDYKILKVYTDKKATLKAKIRIVPIEAVEDFDLEVSLEDSFGETAAVVAE